MVRILTDSACDLTPARAADFGVDIIPNIVTFPDGKTIRDNVDMSADEFYKYMAKSSALPTTGQPGPDPYLSYFEAAKAAGDTVVVICLSGELSSLVDSARLAARLADFEDSCYVVDSFQASLSMAIQVRRAAKLRDAGYDAAEIAMTLEREKRHTHLLGMVEDLDHLRKGGRLNVMANITGKLLGIKPLIEINGKVCAIGKARGWKAACAAIIKNIESMGGILTDREYMLGYSVDPHEVDILQDYITKTLHLPPAELGQIGAAVGTHVGPGTFGIVFYDNKTYEK
ncbi:MAG: DegV family protein [Clostridia bacterium]|nr:DegV family protein [Clostridia bacterium]